MPNILGLLSLQKTMRSTFASLTQAGHYLQKRKSPQSNDVWIHDEFDKNSFRAYILSHFTEMEGFPTPVGIFRQEHKSSYDEDFHEQINNIKKIKGEGDLRKLLFSGNMWEVS